jgi:hypothetical protein
MRYSWLRDAVLTCGGFPLETAGGNHAAILREVYMKWVIIIALLVIGGFSVVSHLIGFSFDILAWVFHHPVISVVLIGAGIGASKLITKK